MAPLFPFEDHLSVLRTRSLLPAILLSLIFSMLTPSLPASAAGSYEGVIDITFPVTGSNYRFTNDYHQTRSRGAHGATDIMAPPGTPIVSASAGTVTWVSTPATSGCGYCLDITDSAGRTFGYVHNGPKAAGNDSKAFARAWRKGDRVARGQLIAYVGCSGNASCSPGGHHLHFQIEDPSVRDPYGDARRNPYQSLKAAEAAAAAVCTASGSFSDVCDSNVHADDIERLLSASLTNGCGEDRFCPDASVTRDQMASFLVRALELSGRNAFPFRDVTDDNAHYQTIARLAAEDITKGCGTDVFCPTNVVTRGQMASFIVRARELPGRTSPTFSDVPSSYVHARDISALAAAGITKGCGDTTFCPHQPVTRAQMASFLVRAFVD